MKAIYLKVNRPSDYFIPSVKNAVEIMQFLPNRKIFFICDNPQIRAQIEKEVDLSSLKFGWIQSQRDDPDVKLIVNKATVPMWNNAGFAHMTTFWHARENHFENFWNMDADDFRFFDPPEKVAKMFDEVERVADEKQIKIFSLDLWPTLSYGKHWSFGTTYVDNRFPWIDNLKKIVTSDSAMENYHIFVTCGRNIYWFFTFLRLTRHIRGIETFYVESLRFAHHLPDLYLNFFAGIRYCESNRYHISFFENDFGLGESGSIPIDYEVYKIDIGLTVEDSHEYFRTHYSEPGTLENFRTINRLEKIPKSDLKITVILNLPHDIAITDLLETLKKEVRDFRLIFLDNKTFHNAKFLVHWNRLFFPQGIKVIPKNEFSFEKLKTQVVIIFNGSEDEDTIKLRLTQARDRLKILEQSR